MISPPVSVEPVNAILSTPGCRTRCAPIVLPSPGTTLITPGGKPTSPASSASRSAVSGVAGVGLQDDRAAGRERGRELPRRHHQRVVPGHDLPGDADRLLQRVEEERAADRIRAAGDRRDRRCVEAEVLDRLRQLGLHRGDAPCRRCAPRARPAPCGSRRSRRRARAGAASARSAGSWPRRRRARARAASTARSTSCLGGHRDGRERLAGRGLGQLARLAGRGLGRARR